MTEAAALERSDNRSALHAVGNPYPGIRPFEESEWRIFFGRQSSIEQLLQRLSKGRFAAVVGASGDGKSSVVRAGLFATLKHRHARIGVPWRTADMRPGVSPMWALAEALHAATMPGEDMSSAPVEPVEFVRATLARGSDGIAAVLQERDFPADQNLLLLVDQFEELFRYDVLGGEAEIRTFLDQLVDAVERPPEGFYLIVTMRAEFLGDCARFPRFADALNEGSYLLRQMSGRELTEAILRPAELCDGTIEPALLDRLVHDASGEQDQLPLLQHALMWLWTRKAKEARAANRDAAPTLGLIDYERVNGMTGALSEHLDGIYAGLGGQGATAARVEQLQRATRRVFQALSEVKEHGRVTRRPLRFKDLVAETGRPEGDVAEVVEVFRAVGRSFLLPAPPIAIEATTVIDVGHEAILRRWDRLSGATGWLREEQADSGTWERLLLRVRAFRENPRRLLEAEETAEFTDFWSRRSPSEAWLVRYMRPSLRLGSETEAPKPALVQDASALLAKSHRRDRLRRWSVIALVVVVLAAVVGVGLSLVLATSYRKEQVLRATAEASLGREQTLRTAAETAATQAKASAAQLAQVVHDLAEAKTYAPAESSIAGAISRVQTTLQQQATDLQQQAVRLSPSAYTVFLHGGGGPADAASTVHTALERAGFTVHTDALMNDSDPRVDYFQADDLAAARNVSAIVDAALPPGTPPLEPRQQHVTNPPKWFGVWLFQNPMTVDAITWNSGSPAVGWCFQRDRRAFAENPTSNFLVSCFPSQGDCASINGGSRGPATACNLVTLGTVVLEGRGSSPKGRPSSWFQYSPQPFGPPFPQLAP